MILRKKTGYNIFYAWILLLVFTATHICKDLDFHFNQHNLHPVKTEKTSSKAYIKAYCSICHFIWQKSEAAKNITFIPVLIGILIVHYEIKEITIWRPIYSINAHSPPTLLLI